MYEKVESALVFWHVSKSDLMEFSMLLRLVGWLKPMLKLFFQINVQGRSSFLRDVITYVLIFVLRLKAYGLISSKHATMIENT